MPKPPPAEWRHISEGPVSDYTVLSVRELRVADPRNGSIHPRVRIDAPDWVNVVPLTDQNELVMIRQFRCGIWSNTLELPGGLIDPGEDPAGAAARELEEETGFRADSIVPLGVCHPNPAIQSNRIWSYLALGCHSLHDGHPDEGEDISVELVPQAEVPRLVKSGTISHGLVLAALYFQQLQRSG